jgi:multidrug efflux pump subunit AcrB
MVRYPAQDRQSLGKLEHMNIRTSDSDEVPLSVAETQYGKGFSSINREHKQRIVYLTGDVNRATEALKRLYPQLKSFYARKVAAL